LFQQFHSLESVLVEEIKFPISESLSLMNTLSLLLNEGT